MVNRTPLLTSRTLNDRASQAVSSVGSSNDGKKGETSIKVEVALKCENFQVLSH